MPGPVIALHSVDRNNRAVIPTTANFNAGSLSRTDCLVTIITLIIVI